MTIIPQLLFYGAKIDKAGIHGRTALMWAAFQGSMALLGYLSNGAHLGISGKTADRIAIEHGHKGLGEMLVREIKRRKRANEVELEKQVKKLS